MARAMSVPVPRRPLRDVLEELVDLDAVDEARRWTSVCALEIA